jgi:osmoprotectant transport system ATP-binding protein
VEAARTDDGGDVVVALRDVTVVPPGAAAAGGGGRRILDGLSLEVRRGERLVLLGRSGCGKTTTLRLVNRLAEPSGGAVHVLGRAATAWDPVELRRHVGYVIQEAGLMPHWSVARNVALVPSLLGWEQERARARADELLALVGLDPGVYAARFPAELSGGQRQRVGIARALAADPPLLLMDEPFGALDPITRAGMQREFRALAERLGKTVVMVTHDVREALLLATRIALLREGRLAFLGAPEALLASDDAEARAFTAELR